MARTRDAAIAKAAETNGLIFVAAATGVAWSISAFAQLTGTAIAFHHHTLIEGGPPLPVALLLFLVAWQVMVAAMMLPASLPAVRSFEATASALSRPVAAMLAFLATYAAVWTVYGIGAFFFDVGLHRLTDATPWLAARPWLIEATALTAAGVYQFLPIKRRGLEACRHLAGVAGPDKTHESGTPASGFAGGQSATGAGVRVGLRHGIDCLTCSWALMLLMFAAGFANLWWMAALAVAMGYETIGRHGRGAASVIGALLLALAAAVFLTASIPAFAAS
jgi:predicted metal-binding membrane protein